MPLYEYLCPKCGHTFEVLCSFSARPQTCPQCGHEKTERVLSTTAPGPKQSAPSCPGSQGASPCMGADAPCCRGCCGRMS